IGVGVLSGQALPNLQRGGVSRLSFGGPAGRRVQEAQAVVTVGQIVPVVSDGGTLASETLPGGEGGRVGRLRTGAAAGCRVQEAQDAMSGSQVSLMLRDLRVFASQTLSQRPRLFVRFLRGLQLTYRL